MEVCSSLPKRMKHCYIKLLFALFVPASRANAQRARGAQENPGNPCIICPNGVGTGMGDVQWGENTGTCSELIDAAKQYETGSRDCAWAESDAISCCPTEPQNPCIICPNGVTEGYDDLIPPGDTTGTCAENIDYAKRFETGSDYCGVVGELEKSYCCPPAITTAMNPCIICPNGVDTGMDDVPYGENSGTCAELMDAAKLYETGSWGCAWAESNAIDCCTTVAENPCIICPNGVHTGMGDVKPFVEIVGTCAENIDYTKYFETESDYCGVVGELHESYCCPPVNTTAMNPCIICVSTGMGDVPIGENNLTCAELMDAAKLYETGSQDCAWAESNAIDCCLTEPENPCIICPNGVNTGMGDVEPFVDITGTCTENIDYAKRFETESDYCGVAEMYEAFCCSTTTSYSDSYMLDDTLFLVLVSVIPIVAGVCLMALAVYYLRKRAAQVQGPATTSPAGVDQIPEGGIPTAVASKINPETVDTTFFQLYPVPPPAYAPYASASAPPRE